MKLGENENTYTRNIPRFIDKYSYENLQKMQTMAYDPTPLVFRDRKMFKEVMKELQHGITMDLY